MTQIYDISVLISESTPVLLDISKPTFERIFKIENGNIAAVCACKHVRGIQNSCRCIMSFFTIGEYRILLSSFLQM